MVSQETLATTAALTVDDALRQVPGFTLFRRTGSRTANPTTQGVSLRGIGASGASRALVLDDGIPLNDPYGGWIYWDRVPRAAIDRVEVVRGGASDLYGSAAMGGVIQLFRRTQPDSIVADVSAGSQQTANASLHAILSRGLWHGSLAANGFTTGGYIPVAASQRGAVDREADSHHNAIDATIGRGPIFLRASHFTESRNNGTPLQINDTRIHQLALGLDHRGVTARAYATGQKYHQTFSAIAAGRASERLTNDQRIPSRALGGSAQIVRGQMVMGVEGLAVRGAGDEQKTWSAFAERSTLLGMNTNVTASLRFDHWTDSAWSPRIAVVHRINQNVAVTGAAYRAFRAPTLNELYRPFRVGNINTLANPDLGPERLTAFEAGVRSGPVRLTMYSMKTADAVTNVTLSTTPALITRQRQNAGSSRSRGAELDAEYTLRRDWRVSAGYLFVDATLDTGKRVPQVPRNQATLQLAYRSMFGVQMRWSAIQFDDDLNTLPLRGFISVDAFASRPVTASLDAIVAVENALDRRIEAGATPVVTFAGPRSWRVGVRFKLGS